MEITPSTVLYVLSGVPLDNTYNHTLYFTTQSAQANYFMSKAKSTLSRLTFQRHTNDSIKVGIPIGSLYDCNYIMFRNSAYDNKWFYAFITNVEYINNNTSIIYYQIDVLQTWHFDYKLGECFVEREHTESDELYQHLVPENLSLGEYKIVSSKEFDMSKLYICVLTTQTSDGAKPDGKTYHNVYTPLNVIDGIDPHNHAAINSAIKTFIDAGQEDAIVSIFEYPQFLGKGADASTVKKVAVNVPYPSHDIDGYVPKNKKLFSYPYSYLALSNNCGLECDYRFENFSGREQGNIHFQVCGVYISSPQVLAYPKWYSGMEDNYDEGLVYNNFPLCAWAGDTYKAWMVRNKSQVETGFVNSAFSNAAKSLVGGALIASGNPIGLAVGASTLLDTAGKINNLMSQKEDLQRTPPQMHGQAQFDCLNAGLNKIKYTWKTKQIKREFAKCIDDYFTMFGYRRNEVKIPNRFNRKRWTYTKTAGCVIKGNLPNEDMNTICRIYDNGITFWRNPEDVGNYNLDNPPFNG